MVNKGTKHAHQTYDFYKGEKKLSQLPCAKNFTVIFGNSILPYAGHTKNLNNLRIRSVRKKYLS
jgi:hypothetical protein